MEQVVSEISGDRRARRRYDVDLKVHYRVLRQDQVVRTGSGKTFNISGGGIACQLDETLKPGSKIELSIAWPVMLNQNCALKLVVTGKIIRSDSSLTALRMKGYEFRTQGVRPIQAAAATGFLA
jgi:c-di-GMP-binding flagellar brake protein YcgR